MGLAWALGVVIALLLAVASLAADLALAEGIPWASPGFVIAYACAATVAGLLIWGVTLTRTSRSAAVRRRAYRVANRILECSSQPSARAKLPPPSPLGLEASVARAIEQLSKPMRFARRKPRKYTDRVHRRFQAVLEDLARHDLKDTKLTYYFGNHPTSSECLPVAMNLMYLADQLPASTAGAAGSTSAGLG